MYHIMKLTDYTSVLDGASLLLFTTTAFIVVTHIIYIFLRNKNLICPQKQPIN